MWPQYLSPAPPRKGQVANFFITTFPLKYGPVQSLQAALGVRTGEQALPLLATTVLGRGSLNAE